MGVGDDWPAVGTSIIERYPRLRAREEKVSRSEWYSEFFVERRR